MIKHYNFDENIPVIVENAIKPSILKILQKYYRKCLSQNIFEKEDIQSNCFKVHNEFISRILHYEMLPFINHIIGKKLKPTYTYMSFYTKGCDLPAHTDRPECQYTVSMVIDKPSGSNWNCYVDKNKQSVASKGTVSNLDRNKCYSIDCQAGGLMIFCGTNHAYFRDKLAYDYYNIMLLYYMDIDC